MKPSVTLGLYVTIILIISNASSNRLTSQELDAMIYKKDDYSLRLLGMRYWYDDCSLVLDPGAVVFLFDVDLLEPEDVFDLKDVNSLKSENYDYGRFRCTKVDIRLSNEVIKNKVIARNVSEVPPVKLRMSFILIFLFQTARVIKARCCDVLEKYDIFQLRNLIAIKLLFQRNRTKLLGWDGMAIKPKSHIL